MGTEEFSTFLFMIEENFFKFKSSQIKGKETTGQHNETLFLQKKNKNKQTTKKTSAHLDGAHL